MGIDVFTLNKAKRYTNLVALGLASATVDDVNKTITFTLAADGSQHTIHFDQPKDGVSITNISVDANNNLVCTMSDGTEYKSKIDLLDNVYTKTETDTLLLDKAEKNHNHDSAYASKDKEHEHSNKETLDKFGVNDGGKLTFNGDVVTPEAMDLSDYLKKTDAQNTYVAKETGKGLSENDFTTVLKDAYDKAAEDSHTHSNKSVIDKFSESADGALLYDGQSIEADLSTVYKKDETYSQTESDDKFVAKESGKGLSSNDLTNELKSSYDDAVTAKHTHDNKTVLDGITAEKVEAWDKAEENVQSDWNETDDTADGFIKNKPTIPDAYDDTALSGRVDDVETSIGDMSLIEVKSVSDLVSAINALYNAFMSSITYADKKLTITYRNGGTVDIDMSAIITDTNIGELSNIDDTGVADKQVLSYDIATNKYIPTTIDTAGVLANAKKYTDDEIAKINNADAMAVDEKPIYSDGTITYKKGGVESTITDGDFWFFYTVDDMAYQTIWIDGVEFTTSVDGSVDFKDFVSKTNDLVSTYTGEETDKTKVATIASLDALYAIISTALGKKVNTTDIVDSLSSDSTDKPLSAAQGKALDTKISDLVTTVEEGYAKKTDIPTTLPANGGNSDTVNNHTVKSDVPENAVFTDTIYDDTEVKGNIEEVSSNLDTLEFGEIAGGKNLWNLESSYTTTTDTWALYRIEMPLKAGTYRLSCSYNTSAEFIFANNSNTDVDAVRVNPNNTFTLSKDTKYVCLWINTGTVSNIQIEKGTTATPYEPYIPSVKMLAEEVNAQNESLSVIGKCKNLLNPTLQTTTQNGVTCTNNGDGTYTVSGTNSTSKNITFIFSIPHNGKGKGKLVGCPQTSDAMLQTYYNGSWGYSNTWDKGNGSVLDKMELLTSLSILVYPGKTVNLTFKPMLTTNLNATYDDFVPYTGDGETLTHDVAEIKNNLNELKISDIAGGKNLCDVSSIAVKQASVIIGNMLLPIGQYTFSADCDITSGSVDLYGDTNSSMTGGTNLAFKSGRISKTFTVNTPTYVHSYASTTANLTNIQIEKGSTLTDYEPYIPSVKMLAEEVNAQNESLSVIGKCKNLLNPTLQTSTLNGITCTNNGDGTYTLNGTASSHAYFVMSGVIYDKNIINKYEGSKLVGAPSGSSNESFFLFAQFNGAQPTQKLYIDCGNGIKLNNIKGYETLEFIICVKSGKTVPNLTFKPMITTNLNATYDDFVPYTGDGETLASDVSDIKKDLGGLTFSASGTTLTITDGTNTWTLGANS